MGQGRGVNWCKVQRRTFGIYLLEGLLHFIYTSHFFFKRQYHSLTGAFDSSYAMISWHPVIPRFLAQARPFVILVASTWAASTAVVPVERITTEVLRHWLCQPLRWTTNDQCFKGQDFIGHSDRHRKYLHDSFHFSILFVNCSQVVFLFPPWWVCMPRTALASMLEDWTLFHWTTAALSVLQMAIPVS